MGALGQPRRARRRSKRASWPTWRAWLAGGLTWPKRAHNNILHASVCVRVSAGNGRQAAAKPQAANFPSDHNSSLEPASAEEQPFFARCRKQNRYRHSNSDSLPTRRRWFGPARANPISVPVVCLLLPALASGRPAASGRFERDTMAPRPQVSPARIPVAGARALEKWMRSRPDQWTR